MSFLLGYSLGLFFVADVLSGIVLGVLQEVDGSMVLSGL